MKKLLLNLILLPFLNGCSVGHYEYNKETLSKADMNFVGIPTILGAGILGSSVPITPEYSLTAAHVAKYMMYKVKAYHPACDLALIYHKNNENTFPSFRNGVVGETINMYGYSFFSAMPVASKGTILKNVLVRSSWNKIGCPLAISKAGVVQGMSGGPVYNQIDNTLTGIVEGYAYSLNNKDKNGNKYKDVSLYVPYSSFSIWLNKELMSK